MTRMIPGKRHLPGDGSLPFEHLVCAFLTLFNMLISKDLRIEFGAIGVVLPLSRTLQALVLLDGVPHS